MNKLSDRKIKEILSFSNLINIKKEQIMAQEKVYTEGIAFDGAAILENGLPITISQVLKKLNDAEELKNLNKLFSSSKLLIRELIEIGFVKSKTHAHSYNFKEMIAWVFDNKVFLKFEDWKSPVELKTIDDAKLLIKLVYNINYK